MSTRVRDSSLLSRTPNGEYKVTEPIFIVGSPRSGTTLLQCMLSAHPSCFSLPETHYFCTILPNIGLTPGDQLTSEHLDLLRDALLEKIPTDKVRALFAHLLERDQQINISALGLFNQLIAVHSPMGSLLTSFRWVEKTPYHVFYLHQILECFPSARFINLIRDPRDVVSSRMMMPNDGVRSVIDFAQDWNRCINSAKKFTSQYPENILHLRYEDLISKPALSIQTVCIFLGLTNNKIMLSDFGAQYGDCTLAKYETWKEEVRCGEIHDKRGIWRARMSLQDAASVECETMINMEECQYKPEALPLIEKEDLGFQMPGSLSREELINITPSLPIQITSDQKERQEKTKIEALPLLIYQMGKVGSGTVLQSLKASGYEGSISHVHTLSPSGIQAIEENNIDGLPPHISESYRILELLEAMQGDLANKWNIITLVRDPIARNISAFFQNIRKWHHEYRPEIEIDSDGLAYLHNLFLNRYPHHAHLDWFDRELLTVFGIDVFQNIVTMDDGYSIYSYDNADLLFIKLEQLDNCAEAAFKEFLDIEDFKVCTTHVGNTKPYGRHYRRFKETIQLTDAFMDRMYRSKYVRHFYTQKEIRTFVSRWRGTDRDLTRDDEIKKSRLTSDDDTDSKGFDIEAVQVEVQIDPQKDLALEEIVLEASRNQLAAFQDTHQGERCVIIGNGPSLNRMDLSFLCDEITFGTNRIYLGFDKWGFVPNYYVSVNPLVIEQSIDSILEIPAPRFISHHGIPFLSDTSQALFMRSLPAPCFSRDPRRGIWEGFTVTFAAMQLAYFMGFSEVVLIGVDHNFCATGEPNEEVISQGSDEDHFDPNYFGEGVRWHLPDLKNSEMAYRLAKYVFEADGRKILDATVGGLLRVFQKIDYRRLFHQSPSRNSKHTEKKPLILDTESHKTEAPPLVSLIVTSGPNLGIFKDSIRSVETQTYPNLEIIVINTDEGELGVILEELQPRYSLLEISAKDCSLAKARNRGLTATRGEYVAYLDAGWQIHPDHIATLQVYLESHSEFDVGYTLDADKPRSMSAALHPICPEEHPTPIDIEELLSGNIPSVTNFMHRKGIVGEIGTFNEDLKHFSDWDFLIRLSLHSPFAQICVETAFIDPSLDNQVEQQTIDEKVDAYRDMFGRYAQHTSNSVRIKQEAFLASMKHEGTHVGDEQIHEWPEEVNALVQEADQLVHDGFLEPAAETLLRALAIAPTSAWIHVARGNIFLHLGMFDAAEISFSQALDINPNDYEALTSLVVIYLGLGRVLEAEAVLNRVERLRPNDEAIMHLRKQLNTLNVQAMGTPLRLEERHEDREWSQLRKSWDSFGQKDPMWAILTRPSKRGNKWQPGEFFETGIRDINSLLVDLRGLGISMPMHQALDFGCGIGRLSQALALHFSEVYGVDIAESMIAQAKIFNRFSQKCRYLLNDIELIPAFDDGQFDLIYSILTLQHIPPRFTKKYLQEFMRILSSQGVLVFQLPSHRVGEPPLGFDDRLPTQGNKPINGDQAVMEMYGVAKTEVIAHLNEYRGAVAHIVQDRSLGPDWENYKYYIRRR